MFAHALFWGKKLDLGEIVPGQELAGMASSQISC